MPENCIVRVTLQAASNITADNVSNSFCFYTPLFDPDDVDNALDMVEDLYTELSTGATNRLGSYINATMKRQAILKMYRLSDPEPRVPIKERFITLPSPGAGQPYPSEVALCVSFQGERLAGVPQSRRRGRVYLGPLQIPTGAGDRPSTLLLNDVAKHFQALKDASDASLLWQWRIWSPTNSNSVLVDNGWIDNSWDTQRRRGPDPTTRVTFD